MASRCDATIRVIASDASRHRAGSGGIVDRARPRGCCGRTARSASPRVAASGEAIVARRRTPTITITSPQHAAPSTDFVRTCTLCPFERRRVPRGADRFGTLPRMSRTATCIWRVDADLVLALDERLGPPVDSYLNGSQTWITDDGPAARSASSGGSTRSPGTACRAICRTTTCGSRSSARCPSAPIRTRSTLGSEPRTLRSLWDGLECFAAYGDDLEPAPLAQAATDALGRAPDAAGLVDHDAIGTAWEHARGATSIVEMVFAELKSTR